MFKDLDAWIADLRGHRDRLVAELGRVEAALAALAGDTPPPKSSPPRQSGASTSPMLDLLGMMFAEYPDKDFTAETALETLRASGWESDADDPVNAMRTALSRMAKRGDVHRVGRGLYRKNEGGQAAFHPEVIDTQREVTVHDF